MELRNAIEKRRSIRHYISGDIEDKIITDLLDCGRLAPSAKNRQPWFFVVVKGDMKDKIADVMLDWYNKTDITNYENKLGHSISISYAANTMKEANTLILVFKEKVELFNNYDNLSIGACIQNILLRATDLGIGSLWIGDTIYVKEQIANMVDCPNLDLISAIALGYTDIIPRKSPRKALEKIVKRY